MTQNEGNYCFCPDSTQGTNSVAPKFWFMLFNLTFKREGILFLFRFSSSLKKLSALSQVVGSRLVGNFPLLSGLCSSVQCRQSDRQSREAGLAMIFPNTNTQYGRLVFDSARLELWLMVAGSEELVLGRWWPHHLGTPRWPAGRGQVTYPPLPPSPKFVDKIYLYLIYLYRYIVANKQ